VIHRDCGPPAPVCPVGTVGSTRTFSSSPREHRWTLNSKLRRSSARSRRLALSLSVGPWSSPTERRALLRTSGLTNFTDCESRSRATMESGLSPLLNLRRARPLAGPYSSGSLPLTTENSGLNGAGSPRFGPGTGIAGNRGPSDGGAVSHCRARLARESHSASPCQLRFRSGIAAHFSPKTPPGHRGQSNAGCSCLMV
jgi:hypothetical protein